MARVKREGMFFAFPLVGLPSLRVPEPPERIIYPFSLLAVFVVCASELGGGGKENL